MRVLLGEVGDVDLANRVVKVQPPLPDVPAVEVPYDTLLVAAGSKYSYFGHDEWEPYAHEIKSLEHAIEVRGQILAAFEAAELEPDPEKRAKWLTFAVVGAGPDRRRDGGPDRRARARHAAARLPRDGHRARGGSCWWRPGRACSPPSRPTCPRAPSGSSTTSASPRCSTRWWSGSTRTGSSSSRRAASATASAPERSSGPPAWRPRRWPAGWRRRRAPTVDRAGRITVEPDLSLPGHPEVLAFGDMAVVKDGEGGVQDLPGVAPVAMQQGRYAAKVVLRRLADREVKPFKYVDKGNLATIGRARAVAEIKRVHFGGALAWLLWLGIHIFYLIGFQNRLLVLLRWSFSFLTRGRGARLITGEGPPVAVRVSTPHEVEAPM